MKNLLFFGLMLMVSSMLPSCQKNDTETDSEKISNELNAFVHDNEITKCTIILHYASSNQQTVAENMDFTISGGFVIIKQRLGDQTTEDRYNLLYLVSYSYSENPSVKTLILYF